MMPAFTETPPLQLDLEQNSEAPALARAAISGFSEGRDIDTTTLATVTLLVSEIVTNAVIHSEADSSKVRLYAQIADGMVRVEVTDAGSGFTPRPRNPARTDGGYGLYLVDKIAAAWGVDGRDGTTVWFELPVPIG